MQYYLVYYAILIKKDYRTVSFCGGVQNNNAFFTMLVPDNVDIL